MSGATENEMENCQEIGRFPRRVSIVIPCYRQGRFLAESIEDSLRQSHSDVEVIVVNDGSDDETSDIASSYGERIRYFRQANAGVAAARNAGVRTATGDWLLFLDADDRIHPDAAAHLIAAVGGDACSVGVMGFRFFQTDPRRDGTPPILPPSGGSLRSFVLKKTSPPNSYLCPRRAVLEVGGFDEDRSVMSAEDFDMWLKLADRGLIFKPSPFPGAFYRRYLGSLSGNRLQMGRAGGKVILRYLERHIGNAQFVRNLGGDILKHLYAFRRKLRIVQAEPEMERQLTRAIDRLRRRGCRVSAALPIRFQDALPSRLGDLVERFGFWFYSKFRPAFYNTL